MNPIESLKNMISRVWSKVPDRPKWALPQYFHNNARLDPVRVIAKKCASIELKIYDKKTLRTDGDSADPYDEHELYTLLDNPVPTFREIDGWMLRYLTFAHYTLTGEFFWVIVRNGKNPIALLPVPAAWVTMRPTVGNHNFQIYPYGTTASKALIVAQEDVVWFKDPDLSDPYGNGRGMSEPIADEIETDEYASKVQKGFFYNDATPPFVIFSPNGTSESAKQIKASWMDKLAGWMHKNEPAVLTGKDVKIEKLMDSPKELDLVESRKFLRDEALHHYQIPPEIFGILENSNRSTIDAADYMFNKNVIADLLCAIERAINRQLVVPNYGAGIVVKHNHIIAEDEEMALKVYSDGLAKGVVLVNEWRTRFKLPVLPGQDVFLRTFSIVEENPGDNLKPTPEPKPEPDEEITLPETEPDDELELEDEPKKTNKLADNTETDNDRRAKMWGLFDVKASSVESPFKKQVSKIVSVQLSAVKASIRTALEDNKPIENALLAYFGNNTDEAVKRTLAPAWIEAMEAGESHANTLLDLKAAYDTSITRKLFHLWVENFGLKKAKEINDTTHESLREKLSSELAESISIGESLGLRIKRIMSACEGVYDTMSKSRAMLIARTESASSVNFGSFQTYKVYGVQQKEWISVPDDRRRDAHGLADGQTVGIDEKFSVDGEMLDFPGDPMASAENVCNCRCTMAPVIVR